MGEKYASKCGATMLCEPVGEVDVARFEESLGRLLPSDYREFLLEWNGIHFLWGDMADWAAAFPMQPVDDHSRHVPQWITWVPNKRRTIDDCVGTVGRLYGVDCPEDSLWGSNDHYGFKQWTPERFLSVGELGDNIGRICLSLTGHDVVDCAKFSRVLGHSAPNDRRRMGSLALDRVRSKNSAAGNVLWQFGFDWVVAG